MHFLYLLAEFGNATELKALARLVSRQSLILFQQPYSQIHFQTAASFERHPSVIHSILLMQPCHFGTFSKHTGTSTAPSCHHTFCLSTRKDVPAHARIDFQFIASPTCPIYQPVIHSGLQAYLPRKMTRLLPKHSDLI